MGVLVNVNNVWRETKYPSVNVNGVWRNTDQWVNNNGVWRRTYNSYKMFKEENIIGCKFIYTLNKLTTHPLFPGMEYNEKLIPLFNITYPGENNTDTKTIRMELSSEDKIIQGNLLYEGNMYIHLNDDSYIQVMDFNSMDNQLDGISITINGSYSYESKSNNLIGWNYLFKDINNLPEYPNNADSNIIGLTDYKITPVFSRENKFIPKAMLGLVRNFKDGTPSKGIISHTISSVKVNNTNIPFSIELYN